MILKGSQRGGARALADHLLNDRDNDHVTIEELRGFASDSLRGAMAETHAVSKGTRCTQPVFSLSLNPPKDAAASIDELRKAADRAEKVLGLEGQPRALVIHEKEGRRHAHVVWSRIDADELKAINLPFYKTRLKELSKELYLDHGWALPEGHRENGWKNPLNFTLAEWQQAKRLDLDPREIRQAFQEAWNASDGLRAFRAALEERGYYLAKGDRRGFVALDIHGEVFSVSRVTGAKAKEIAGKLGDPDQLPGVEATRAVIRNRMSTQIKGFIAEDRKAKREELRPLADERRAMVKAQRHERQHLEQAQALRWNRETEERAARFRTGFLGKAIDYLSGRYFQIRAQNERETYACVVRDRMQREALHAAQSKDRWQLQRRIDITVARQRIERMQLSGRIAQIVSGKGSGLTDRVGPCVDMQPVVAELPMPKDKDGRWSPEPHKKDDYTPDQKDLGQKVLDDFDKARMAASPPKVPSLPTLVFDKVMVRDVTIFSSETKIRPIHGRQEDAEKEKKIAEKMRQSGEKQAKREFRKRDLTQEFNRKFDGPPPPGSHTIKR